MTTPDKQFRQDELALMEPTSRAILNQLGLTTGDVRQDADAVQWTSRELLYVRRKVFEVNYPDLLGMIFVPPDNESTDAGASHFTYNYTDRVGRAKLAGAMPRGNIPRVDVKTEQATPIEIQSIVLAYGWNLQELRAEIFARRPLSGARAIATRKTMAQEHDDIILIGDGTADYKYLRGLFKLPITGGSAVNVYTVPNGDSGSPLWANKTGMEIVADLHGLCNAIQTATNGVEVASMVGLPLTSMTTAMQKRIGDGSSVSALDYFIEQRKKMTRGYFQGVEASVKLETAGATSNKRMAAYDRNADKVFRVDPIEFEQLPPQVDGFETVINCHMRTAGVCNPYPKSVAYGDGI